MAVTVWPNTPQYTKQRFGPSALWSKNVYGEVHEFGVTRGNAYGDTNGVIYGDVTEILDEGQPPYPCRVVCLASRGFINAGTTWTEPDGTFKFTRLDQDNTYFLMAIDPHGKYDPVAIGYVVPDKVVADKVVIKPWTPDMVPGFVFLLDSEKLMTLGANGVATWKTAMTGGGLASQDFRPINQAQSPDYIDSQYGKLVRFGDGKKNLMNNSGPFSSVISRTDCAWSVTFVLRRGSAADTPSNVVSVTNAGGGVDQYTMRLNTPTAVGSIGITTARTLPAVVNKTTVGPAVANNDPLLIYSHGDSESGALIQVNGGSVTPGTPDGFTQYQTVSAMWLGSENGNNANSNFDMRFMVFGAGPKPTKSDRDRLVGWAAHTYGLTDLLPAKHPYKDRAPTVSNEPEPTWTPTDMDEVPAIILDWDSEMRFSAAGVSHWSNRGALGGEFVQGTPAQTPIVAPGPGGIRAVSFDGVDDWLSGTQAAIQPVLANRGFGSSLIVYKKRTVDATPKSRQILTISGAATAPNRFTCYAGRTGGTSNSPALATRRLDNDTTAVLYSTDAQSEWCIAYYEMNWAKGVGRIFVNGVVVAEKLNLTTPGNTSPGISGGVLLGSYNLNDGGDVDVAAALVMNTPVSEADRLKMEGWAAWKCQLQDKLPASHPFKTKPPGLESLEYRQWTPTDMDGIRNWMDPDEGVKVNSGKVNEWKSKLSTGNVFTQATLANQPAPAPAPRQGIYFGPSTARQSLKFTDMTKLNTEYWGKQSTWTLFVGVRYSHVQSSVFSVNNTSSVSTQTMRLNYSEFPGPGNPRVGMGLSAGRELWLNGGVLPNGEPMLVYSASVPSTGLYLAQNGGGVYQALDNQTPTTLQTNALVIGQGNIDDSANDFDMWCLISGAGATPSDDARRRLEGWAAHKYGITANLPVWHPYKETPPMVLVPPETA